MTTFTNPYNLPLIEATDKIASSLPGQNLREEINAVATRANDAILGVDNKVATSMYLRGPMPGAQNLDNLTTPGFYTVSTAGAAGLLTPALPVIAAGVMAVLPNTATTVQEWRTTGGAGRINETWTRELNAGTWNPWRPMGWEKAGDIPAGTNIDTLPSRLYHVWSASKAGQLGLPGGGGGALEVIYITGTAGVQRYTTYSSGEVWQRVNSVGWTVWRRIDIPAPPPSSGAVSGKGSGYKTVPLALTLPSVGNSTTTITSRAERHRMGWNAPVTRFRVHIRNAEYRIGQVATGAIPFTGLWFGPEGAAAGDYAAAPTQLHGAFTSAADGSEWLSPWFSKELLPGSKYLLSYGFNVTAGQKFFYHVGTSYATNAAADASAIDGPPGSGLPLLDVWIEAETPAGTPLIGSLGDSISCGVGAVEPVQDSWLSKYAYSRKALPVHYGGSSETLANSINVSMEKWTRWAGTARLDTLIMALGSNDIFTGSTLATVQANMATVMAAVRAYVTDSVHLATITPRTAVTGAQETVRRNFNSWAKTLPLGARDVFDFSAAVSTDDETIIPAYDADGIHMTTAGYQAMSDSIIRPVTTPPLMYQVV